MFEWDRGVGWSDGGPSSNCSSVLNGGVEALDDGKIVPIVSDVCGKMQQLANEKEQDP